MSAKFSRWSAEEDAKLMRLFDVERLSWLQIADALPGRTAAACQIRYYKHLGGAKRRPHLPGGPKAGAVGFMRRRRVVELALAAAKPAPSAKPAPEPVVERKRVPALDHLREAAALRLRIERQGLTAGFFGDPPPGRSALDERARAAAEAAQRRSGHGGSDAG